MNDETTWAGHRVKEAVTLALRISDNCEWFPALSIRMFRFSVPTVNIAVQLNPPVHMIDVEIEINFNKETDDHE